MQIFLRCESFYSTRDWIWISSSETEFLQQRYEYWQQKPKDDYKIDMECLVEMELQTAIGHCYVHQVFPEEIQSLSVELMRIEMKNITLDQLSDLKANFEFFTFGSTKIFGFCIWFDVDLGAGIVLSTSPYADVTHWAQTVLYVEPFQVRQDTKISGRIQFGKSPMNSRELSIKLEFAIDDGPKLSYETNELILQ